MSFAAPHRTSTLHTSAQQRPLTAPTLPTLYRRAADNEAEAEARADILSKAGLVLRFNGMVYLRPEEVSEMVYRVRLKRQHTHMHPMPARQLTSLSTLLAQLAPVYVVIQVVLLWLLCCVCGAVLCRAVARGARSCCRQTHRQRSAT